MFYMHDIGWGWWLLMSVGTLAFWALLIFGLDWLIRGEHPQQHPEAPPETPEEILKRRLAADEFTIEEYKHLREAFDEQPRKPIAA